MKPPPPPRPSTIPGAAADAFRGKGAASDIADASHELRTPLSIIKANTNLALEHPWPVDRYHEIITAIDAAANRQHRLVEELLFLARADAGGLARDVGPVCLLEVLEEAAEAVEGPHQPCVRLEVVGPDLVGPGSGSELTRLFTNLLQNAVRHTPPSGTITTTAASDARSVVVNVTDTGEGIPPEQASPGRPPAGVPSRVYSRCPLRIRAMLLSLQAIQLSPQRTGFRSSRTRAKAPPHPRLAQPPQGHLVVARLLAAVAPRPAF